MARAVMRLKKGAQLAFGPTVEGGFYYDFQIPDPLREEDFPAIEAEMKKIIALDEPFERIEVDRNRAIGGNDVSNAGNTRRCKGCGDADGARVDGGIDHGVELEQQLRVSRVANHAARACSSLP
jgi:hypothetical protein